MQSGLSSFKPSTFRPILSTDFIPIDPPKKKKKKRSRDDTSAGTPEPAAPKEKKKKRKHNSNSSSGDTPVVTTLEQDLNVLKEPSKKDKKKKKDKGKAKEAASTPTAAPDAPEATEEVDESVQASAAALLSAILAAAGSSPEMTTPQPPPDQMIDPQLTLPMIPPGHTHFMPMPPPGPYIPHPQQIPDPTALANMGLPLPDLQSSSNEDVLRALQDLDMTKIANVLKTLGEAAAVAAGVSPMEPFQPPPIVYPPMNPPVPAHPSPVNGFPAPSNAILGVPPKRLPRMRFVEGPPPVPEQPGNPDHATLLSTRWLNASKLAELVRTEGLVYKKGKFSAIEEQALQDQIVQWKAQHHLSDDQIQEIIFPPKGQDRRFTIEFWQQLTAAVPLRPIIAVYHHIRRTHHPLKLQGRWSEEEDGRLKQAVLELGQQWEKVSLRVGRMSSDCRDRYRNHIQDREVRVTGPWSKEEEMELTRIVTDMTIRQGRDIDNDVFWGKVSALMGGRRGRQQCRIKWTDALSKTVKNEGEKPRWSQQDAFILVHKVDSLGVRDDTEIDWKTLPDPDWNLWSAHTLQRRWLTMKRSVKGFEKMAHAEIMDILRQKKAHLPTEPTSFWKKRKERKVTSAEAIAEGGDADSNADESEEESGSDEDTSESEGSDGE